MWRVNTKRAASEIMHGEVVVLDQIVGNYYSLGGAGTDLWQMLLDGATEDGLVAELVARYELPPGGEAEVAEATRGFVATLVADTLLDDVAEAAPPRPPYTGAKAAWAAPRLERFTDLQALLLLDPIHDVNDEGWPRQGHS